jgi:hypothetical protein
MREACLEKLVFSSPAAVSPASTPSCATPGRSSSAAPEPDFRHARLGRFPGILPGSKTVEKVMPRPHRDLFLVSFLILFFELAAIRWFAATVVFLTFFTNIVLLARLLGMSVGLLAARRPQNLIRASLPLAMLSLVMTSGKLPDQKGRRMEARASLEVRLPRFFVQT